MTTAANPEVERSDTSDDDAQMLHIFCAICYPHPNDMANPGDVAICGYVASKGSPAGPNDYYCIVCEDLASKEFPCGH